MAKTVKHQDRQFVSTKAMYRGAKEIALAAMLRKTKAGKVSKSSKQSKTKQVQIPEHALSIEFSDAIESSRDHVYETAVIKYDAAYMGLSQRLANIDLQCTEEEQALAESSKMLYEPFKNEEIEFRSEDGNQTGVIVLGHRMKKAQKTVDAMEQELFRQYDEWLANEAEINSMAPVQAGMPLPVNIIDQEHAAMMEELEAEKAMFEKMMDDAAKASIKEMKDCEKALRLKNKEMENMFSAMLHEAEF